jgi:hypothetical protein
MPQSRVGSTPTACRCSSRQDMGCTASAYFVYHSRRELPRAVKAFMDFTVAQMRERGLSGPRPPHPDREGVQGAGAGPASQQSARKRHWPARSGLSPQNLLPCPH